MANFGQFKKLKVEKNQTQRYEMTGLDLGTGKVPVLLVLSATEINEGYFNALLKSRNMVGRKGLTMKALKSSRDEDKALFAKFVIKGWENVFDESGNQVKFSSEECEAFLDAIIENAPDEFTKLRAYCNDIANWRPDMLDAEEVAKN